MAKTCCDSNQLGHITHDLLPQGMLSIGAAMLGSSLVIGIDVDDDALQTASDNIQQFDGLPVRDQLLLSLLLHAFFCDLSCFTHIQSLRIPWFIYTFPGCSLSSTFIFSFLCCLFFTPVLSCVQCARLAKPSYAVLFCTPVDVMYLLRDAQDCSGRLSCACMHLAHLKRFTHQYFHYHCYSVKLDPENINSFIIMLFL